MMTKEEIDIEEKEVKELFEQILIDIKKIKIILELNQPPSDVDKMAINLASELINNQEEYKRLIKIGKEVL